MSRSNNKKVMDCPVLPLPYHMLSCTPFTLPYALKNRLNMIKYDHFPPLNTDKKRYFSIINILIKNNVFIQDFTLVFKTNNGY